CFVSMPGCAKAYPAIANTTTAIWFMFMALRPGGLKPRRVRDLFLFRDFLVHLDPDPGTVRNWDESFLYDLALLHEGLPEIEVIDPVPFQHEKVRDCRADVRRCHRAHRRDDAVRCERDVVRVRH